MLQNMFCLILPAKLFNCRIFTTVCDIHVGHEKLNLLDTL